MGRLLGGVIDPFKWLGYLDPLLEGTSDLDPLLKGTSDSVPSSTGQTAVSERLARDPSSGGRL